MHFVDSVSESSVKEQKTLQTLSNGLYRSIDLPDHLPVIAANRTAFYHHHTYPYGDSFYSDVSSDKGRRLSVTKHADSHLDYWFSHTAYTIYSGKQTV